jgi:hypothetical protein
MATTFTGHYTCGLFLCGHVENKVYLTPFPDIDTSKARIRGILAAATEEMLEKTSKEIEYRT